MTGNFLDDIIKSGGITMNLTQLTAGNVLDLLPKRKADSHKGDYGRILLLCGSKGYTGAAALAAMGALRAGAGLVYLGVPETIYQIEAVKLTEPIVFPLPEQDGMLSKEAIEKIKTMLSTMDAVLIGPGLGQSEGTLAVTTYILNHFSGPVVVDADGINVLCEHKNILRDRTSPTILTPHPGEYCRLAGITVDNRICCAVNLAKDLDSVVVLKGHETVITDGNDVIINTTGNPGMAVGGSGDVLAGIIVALLGQGLTTLHAAACGAWIHGAAGDVCAKEIGQYGMLPSDMLQVLPRLLK